MKLIICEACKVCLIKVYHKENFLMKKLALFVVTAVVLSVGCVPEGTGQKQGVRFEVMTKDGAKFRTLPLDAGSSPA